MRGKMNNTILCVKWGDKYGREYVEKLKEQCKTFCSAPFNFYCLTDNPTEDYDIQLPTDWDQYEGKHSRYRNKLAPSNMWAYRKLYMFKITQRTQGRGGYNQSDIDFKKIEGDKFLYLDLDVIIHKDLKYFFDLDMERPWIVRGWWNDINECRKNYAAMKSTPINSSVIRWDRGQLIKIYSHIVNNLDVLFFTYPTIDNYLNHFWYNMWHDDKSLFSVFPEGDIYSYYRGNIWPDDLDEKKIRTSNKICLFNNSADTNDVEELKSLW
tara:strand:+ start:697 stop:1497 length:801 start_codon:yes stop_codon:yes gene_type:complete